MDLTKDGQKERLFTLLLKVDCNPLSSLALSSVTIHPPSHSQFPHKELSEIRLHTFPNTLQHLFLPAAVLRLQSVRRRQMPSTLEGMAGTHMRVALSDDVALATHSKEAVQ